MFYLVDTCGKELADFLEKTTADGKLSHDQSSYKFHCEYTVHKLQKFKAYTRVYVCVCVYIYIYIQLYIYLYIKLWFAASSYRIVWLFMTPCYWKTLHTSVTHVPDMYCPPCSKQSVVVIAHYRLGIMAPKLNLIIFLYFFMIGNIILNPKITRISSYDFYKWSFICLPQY